MGRAEISDRPAALAVDGCLVLRVRVTVLWLGIATEPEGLGPKGPALPLLGVY